MSVKIVSETRRQPVEAMPPTGTRPHMWLRPADAKAVFFRLAGNSPLDAYVNKHAEAKMRNHALSARKSRTEVMGLLLGEVRTRKGAEYILVRDVVTSDLDATAVSVKFDSAGFEKLFEKLDGAGFDYVVVGWYHSHPGYGCFLSETDLKTHAGIFVSPHQLAMVIDPLNFEMAAFRVRAGAAVKTDFAVYWDEFDDPYGGLAKVPK